MAEDTTSMGAYELEWAMCEEAAELADERTEYDARIAELEAHQAAMLRAMSAASDESAACIASLQAQLAAARADLARYVARIDEQRESGRQVLTRLLALVEEWERPGCISRTLECAEQVRAILRGEGPQGWERREGGE